MYAWKISCYNGKVRPIVTQCGHNELSTHSLILSLRFIISPVIQMSSALRNREKKHILAQVLQLSEL